MNPEWNTPPNGDFARYVEQLSAQAAARLAASATTHPMDVGMPPSAPLHGGVQPAGLQPSPGRMPATSLGGALRRALDSFVDAAREQQRRQQQEREQAQQRRSK